MTSSAGLTGDRSAPPTQGLPIVASSCANGHRWAGELAWLLPLIFPEDLELTGSVCPDCGAPLRIEAGAYEPDAAGIFRRVGPAALPQN